jgi:hypothetical protein
MVPLSQHLRRYDALDESPVLERHANANALLADPHDHRIDWNREAVPATRDMDPAHALIR